jgi:hypothetical protein
MGDEDNGLKSAGRAPRTHLDHRRHLATLFPLLSPPLCLFSSFLTRPTAHAAMREYTNYFIIVSSSSRDATSSAPRARARAAARRSQSKHERKAAENAGIRSTLAEN